MEAARAQPVPNRIKRIPRPEEPVPVLAWPTVGLFATGLGLFFGSSALAITEVWPWPISTVLNWLALYMLFTVLHDASHRTVSKNETVNAWFGRVAGFFLVPHAGFQIFRFVHMQHHRFTMQDDESDPDYYSSHGKGWRLPVRWATIDLNYFRFYIPKLGKRPRREKIEQGVTWALYAGAVATLIAVGWGFWLLTVWFLPSRLAVFGLGFAFDWLPHHDLHPPGKPPEQTKATRNRVGLERLMTPVTLYQNYHLVHHLHPIIPFYRYIQVWRRNEDQYLEHEPPLTTWGGRNLTPDEYRKLRELEHH